MTNAQFMAFGERIKRQLQSFSPIRTGNLRYNSIRLERTGEDEIRIYVDEKIAPYMPYTNEPWLSPRWNGKKNPNEAWFDNAAFKIALWIAGAFKAQIEDRK